MRWEELTEPKFKQAIKDTGGVCILPLGAIERHGPHLPLGTDMYQGRSLAIKAAEIEKAVVFPFFPFGLIAEASHYPGTIVTDGDLLMRLIEATCQEIARNGFKKIIILSYHGTNPPMLQALTMFQNRSPRDYAIYIYDAFTTAVEDPAFIDKVNTYFDNQEVGGHAGNLETSMLMHIRPDLVHFEESTTENAQPLERLPFLKEHGLFNSMFWYGDYPNHYAGSPAESSAEAGAYILDYLAKKLAQAIKAVREDTEVARLMAEFYSKREH